VVLGDFDVERLSRAERVLAEEGHLVRTQVLDVSDISSAQAFARLAASLGTLRALVHTAGVSPVMASADRIYAVNLLGTALLLDSFYPLAGASAVGVVIASMAGYSVSLAEETERSLATGPTDRLLDVARKLNIDDRSIAYRIAKRGNQLRVEHAAQAWGTNGARIVSVSPGIISTPMASQELKTSAVAGTMKRAALSRVGTPEDIAATVEWLISPAASYITGTDILVDGGVIASRKWH
jgi:NAD(P)-dependent dehydrogenase (short-subunit alcohol dehydrogenase family)